MRWRGGTEVRKHIKEGLIAAVAQANNAIRTLFSHCFNYTRIIKKVELTAIPTSTDQDQNICITLMDCLANCHRVCDVDLDMVNFQRGQHLGHCSHAIIDDLGIQGC